MNCIFTVNTDNFMCDNARSSFIAASIRWGVDYVEVRDRTFTDRYPGYLKAQAARYRISGYDRVAYWDSDCVIREDAPNVFDALPNRELFYVVRDLEESWSVNTESLLAECTRLGINCPVEKDTFFNAGFFLCSPGLWKNLFSYVIHQSPNDHRGPPEQAMLNIAAAIYGDGNISYTDRTWNDCGDWGQPMRSYVYHFAGPFKALAQEQNWKV